MRFLFLVCVGIFGFSCLPSLQGEPPKNVLFIVSDDLNNRLGCYGDPLAISPNIDRLASRGTRFDRAYCTFPLCGPSRNSILTGLYPNSTGIYQNGQIFRQSIPKHASLPHALRRAGYFSGRIGKMYHYNVPSSVGTNGHDDSASWELELNPAGIDRLSEEPNIFTLVPGQFGGTLSWYASPAPTAEHTDAMQAKDAVWVLERFAKERDKPFFLGLGFFRPHTPYVAPRNYFDMHDPQKFTLPDDVEADRADIPRPGLASGKKEQDEMTDTQRREAMQAYYASVTFMDEQVGVVLDALDRLGLADSTMIVFTSDHGYHLGEHGLWQKMSLFEESARVPLLIVAPGVAQPGSVVRSPVSQVDLCPTALEWAEATTRSPMQGQSLTPMLKAPQTVGRGWALTQVSRGGQNDRFFGYSLRTDRWRYTEWDSGERGLELYDHDADPGERTNLAKSEAHKEIVQTLSRQLKDAIQSSYPASGAAPEVRPLTWSPSLTDID
ncbi:MAG: sulfatase [Pirellula sp.]|nr:sulfatase [Pirellula sp.]